MGSTHHSRVAVELLQEGSGFNQQLDDVDYQRKNWDNLSHAR